MYNDENYELYLKITEQEDENDTELDMDKRMKFIERKFATYQLLLDDCSIRSSEFLVSVCQHHTECGNIETNIFEELDRRCDILPQVQELLRCLLGYFINTCTVQHVAQLLAKRKDDKIFDSLLSLLPKNFPTFEMKIPQALDALKDVRAVEHLMKIITNISNELYNMELDEENLRAAKKNKLVLRNRCCLTLGAFKDHPKVIEFLQSQLQTKSLKCCCAAALYRITGEVQYLEMVYLAIQEETVLSHLRPALQEYLQAHASKCELGQACIKLLD